MFDIETLRRNAAAAAGQDEEHKEAIERERAAGTALLALVIQAVMPCLEAVSSKVPFSPTLRGLRVAANGLYLMASGRCWFRPSAVDTAGSGFLTTREVVDAGFSAQEIVESIDKAISAQIRGRKKEQTLAAQRAAAQMNAVANLLRSGLRHGS